MCLFCQLYQKHQEIVYENKHVFVILDHYPVTDGHCLIITKRHVKTYFETNTDEVVAIDEAIRYMKQWLDQKKKPDGYNIGINNHESAGQTVMHFHVHLIPRYRGDTSDPKGGVRAVISGKQKY